MDSAKALAHTFRGPTLICFADSGFALQKSASMLDLTKKRFAVLLLDGMGLSGGRGTRNIDGL